MISNLADRSLPGSCQMSDNGMVRPYSCPTSGRSWQGAPQTGSMIGTGIGKNSFHIVGLDDRAAITMRQKWSRSQVEARLAKWRRFDNVGVTSAYPPIVAV